MTKLRLPLMHASGVIRLMLAALGGMAPLGARAADFQVEATETGYAVTVGGEPFAEYVTRSGRQPAVWPLIDAQGRAVTRSYPMGPLQEHERDDHPHHRSLWFAHGDVNGVDFWTERPDRDEESQIAIVHREFVCAEATGDGAVVVSRNDWNAGDETLLEDKRTLRFGQRDGVRWIDFGVELIASHGEVTLGDTKEGTFAVRVAGTMKVDERLGGKLVNEHGQTNAEAWGREAAWVNYTGPVDGRPAGIVMMSHPDNARDPGRWHVRTYGLFAANPFGRHDFPADDGVQLGALTIPAGESVVFRYLVLLHGGDLAPEQIEAWRRRFAGNAL